MRLIAAVKNIAEGTGTALDAAQVLRDNGALQSQLPPRSKLVQQAKALSKLSKETFQAVYNGVISEEMGAVVGSVIPESIEGRERIKLEKGIVNALVAGKASNELEAIFLAKEVLRTGTVQQDATGMLFNFDDHDNILKERAEMLSTARRMLDSDRRARGFMLREGATIRQYIDSDATLDIDRIKFDKNDIEIMKYVIDQCWTHREITESLNSAAQKFLTLKTGLQQQDPAVQKLVKSLDTLDNTLLGEQAKKLKSAKVQGDTDDITKVRAACAEQFLGNMRTAIEGSGLLGALRSSVGREDIIRG
jgi:hypothetical protein